MRIGLRSAFCIGPLVLDWSSPTGQYSAYPASPNMLSMTLPLKTTLSTKRAMKQNHVQLIARAF